MSDDRSRVSVGFRRFFGEVTGRSGKVSKNCTVSIDIRGAEGYQYTPSALLLSLQSTGLISYAGQLRWSTTSETKTVSEMAGGSFQRTFFSPDFWSPCATDARLHVNAQVTAENRNTEFELLEEVVTFRSRRCLNAPPVEAGPGGKPGSDETSIPSPSDVSLRSVRASGSGCPADSTKVVITPDGKAVSLSFDNLSTARPAACSVSMEVDAPAGQSYALAGLTVSGQATLSAGATARLFVSTAFTGLGVDAAKERVAEVSGPVDGPIKLEETFAAEQLNFSPCDGTHPSLRLNVRPNIAADGQGRLQVTSVDALRFALRKCE